jgi:COMPASS component SPP1
LCRGPDDHRWMICCEKCEDWFHGECINMNKEIGEHLIEKFICPNCSTGDLVTIYKKTCALGGCRKPARLTQSQPSVFCSPEHAQTWWERMVARLPRAKGQAGLNDQLTQEEFMALLNSSIGSTAEDGTWKLVKAPFADDSTDSADAKGGKRRLETKSCITITQLTWYHRRIALGTIQRGGTEVPRGLSQGSC